MWKWTKKLLRLCDHEWEHFTNIMTWNGPMQILSCEKCFKLKKRLWRDL